MLVESGYCAFLKAFFVFHQNQAISFWSAIFFPCLIKNIYTLLTSHLSGRRHHQGEEKSGQDSRISKCTRFRFYTEKGLKAKTENVLFLSNRYLKLSRSFEHATLTTLRCMLSLTMPSLCPIQVMPSCRN